MKESLWKMKKIAEHLGLKNHRFESKKNLRKRMLEVIGNRADRFFNFPTPSDS